MGSCQAFDRVLAAIYAVVIVAVLGGSASLAADPRITALVAPGVSDRERTLTLTARQAHELLQRFPDIRLIDLRTFGETIAGIAAPTFRHIPYMLDTELHVFDARNGRYELVPNPDFPKAIENLVNQQPKGRETTLLLICASGERSLRAAAYLAQLGYPNVYSVWDGIDGAAKGAGSREFTGWRGAHLPWSGVMRPDQAYKSPSM